MVVAVVVLIALGEILTLGSIILFHDDYPQTVEALPAVIAALRDRNLSPVTLSELCPR